MTVPAGNRRVFWVFWGLLGATVFALAGWDVLLYQREGGAETISWSVALMWADNPFLVFVTGHLTGGLLWGLVAHWVGGLPSPALWAELERLRGYCQRAILASRADPTVRLFAMNLLVEDIAASDPGLVPSREGEIA